MDKTLLRSTIIGLNPGQQIDVNFVGPLRSSNGTFEVVAKRRGRGKGASLLADLRRMPGGRVATLSTGGESDFDLTINTARNDEVLNIIVDGEFFGYRSESEVPPSSDYPTNAGTAVELKTAFKGILDNIDRENPVVCIVASDLAPEVNGTFTVTAARQLRGRHGQIVLCLDGGGERKTELWSYRHSGVVQNFENLGERQQAD